MDECENSEGIFLAVPENDGQRYFIHDEHVLGEILQVVGQSWEKVNAFYHYILLLATDVFLA